MNLIKLRKIFFTFALVTLSLMATTSHGADFQNDQGLEEKDLRDSLKRSTRLSESQISGLISALRNQFQTPPEAPIPIRGYLYAHGLNFGFLVDHDTWTFDAVLQDSSSGELVSVPKLFLCDFHNGGIKVEWAYKWMFTFIPMGVDVHQLNGATFGRGVGLVFDPVLGIEGSWLPGKNLVQDVFHVAVKLGLGGGLVFPKMEFKLRQLVPATGSSPIPTTSPPTTI